jgi:hypothetical protein
MNLNSFPRLKAFGGRLRGYRTIIINAGTSFLGIIVAVIGMINPDDIRALLSPERAAMLIAIIGILNVVLRVMTMGPVGEKRPPAQLLAEVHEQRAALAADTTNLQDAVTATQATVDNQLQPAIDQAASQMIVDGGNDIYPGRITADQIDPKTVTSKIPMVAPAKE